MQEYLDSDHLLLKLSGRAVPGDRVNVYASLWTAVAQLTSNLQQAKTKDSNTSRRAFDALSGSVTERVTASFLVSRSSRWEAAREAVLNSVTIQGAISGASKRVLVGVRVGKLSFDMSGEMVV